MNLRKRTAPSPEHDADSILRRRSFLKTSGVALVGAIAFGGSLSSLTLTEALAQSPGGAKSNMSSAVDLGDGDIGVLNYAYALEQLEAAFYGQVIKTPYGGMETAARDVLSAIHEHEMAHREFFKAALKKNAIPDLEVDFTKVDFGNKESVLTTAKTFEDLGVAAYNGAGQLLENPQYLLIAGKIVSVEARHAAAIRDLIGPDAWKDNQIDDKGLDKAMMPSEVLPLAAPYIKTKVTAEALS